MKQLKEIFQETKTMYYRFQMFVKDQEGRKRTVGVAYLQEGQVIYTVRIWTFLNEKFFLLPSKEDPKKYLVMTREPTSNLSSSSIMKQWHRDYANLRDVHFAGNG